MKAKSTKQVASLPHAWIVDSSDQGRKSIKNGNLVYLQDNTEFKIELFNPLKENVLTDIKINSHSINKSGLILRPGERFYLDCYLDDRKKFVFKTYNVENTEESKEAIVNNGVIEVFFYKEEVIQFQNWNNYWNPNLFPYWTNSTITINNYPYNSILCNGLTNTGIYNSYNTTTNLSNSILTNNSVFNTNSSIGVSSTSNTSNNSHLNIEDAFGVKKDDKFETGRIEKGQKSDQQFTEIDMNFHKWSISSIKYKLLPEIQKPIETETIKSKSNYNIELLKKLGELHNCGILSDKEFNDKKIEILNRI